MHILINYVSLQSFNIPVTHPRHKKTKLNGAAGRKRKRADAAEEDAARNEADPMPHESSDLPGPGIEVADDQVEPSAASAPPVCEQSQPAESEPMPAPARAVGPRCEPDSDH